MLQNSRMVAASTAAAPTSEANSRCQVTASGSFEVIVAPIAPIALCHHVDQGRIGRTAPLVRPPTLLAAFFSRHPPVASYSAGRDIAAELISEPSRGTNLDIT